MAASVLLLVPGFPLINAVADMFKGHVNTGLARWAMASLLTLATCIGVVMAMSLWDLRGGHESAVGLVAGDVVGGGAGAGLRHGVQRAAARCVIARCLGPSGAVRAC